MTLFDISNNSNIRINLKTTILLYYRHFPTNPVKFQM